MTAQVLVLGGGISGLAAAHRLRELRPELQIQVLEAQPRPGGLLGSERRDGYVIETGPDSILTEKPWALALIERLGLEEHIVRTDAERRGAYVVCRGRLERIPEGFSLLGPADPKAFLRSSIVSWPGKLRTLAEPLLPARPAYDESLERFVTRRFGRELLERLAQPLVSGIYGADAAHLSLRATMPRFLDLERDYGSVVRGLQERARMAAREAASGARYGMFIAMQGGMQTLIDALQARLFDLVQPETRAAALEPKPSGYRVSLADGRTLEADAVIVAVPAYVASSLLAGLDAELAGLLGSIPYGSAATLTCAWPRAAVPHALDAFGFVVPQIEQRQVLAGTWSSVKFPGRAPQDKALLRVFFGGEAHRALLEGSDEALTQAGLEELRKLMGITALPELTKVMRYPDAMPWYVMGHRAKATRIDQHVERLPRLELAGNAYDGVGIPDAIHRAEQAAERLVASLSLH